MRPRVKLTEEPMVPKTHCALSRQMVTDFCKLIEEGLPADAACDYLGIAPSTYWAWKRKGERYLNGNQTPKEDAIYGYFVQQFRKSLAAYRLKMIRRLHRKKNPYWVRDVTILERRDRKSFSRNEQAGGSDESFDPDERFL